MADRGSGGKIVCKKLDAFPSSSSSNDKEEEAGELQEWLLSLQANSNPRAIVSEIDKFSINKNHARNAGVLQSNMPLVQRPRMADNTLKHSQAHMETIKSKHNQQKNRLMNEDGQTPNSVCA